MNDKTWDWRERTQEEMRWREVEHARAGQVAAESPSGDPAPLLTRRSRLSRQPRPFPDLDRFTAIAEDVDVDVAVDR